MVDFKDSLKKILDNMDLNIEADTMKTIEETGARLSVESKSYSNSDKYIFKENIDYDKAEKLIDITTHFSKFSELDFKKELINQCNIILLIGQNPVEMLIYSIRGISDDKYIAVIPYIIKHISNQNRDKIVTAFKNILHNWLWQDCISIVLECIGKLKLNELDNVVFELFEKNSDIDILTEKSAKVLIDLSAKNKYNSILNKLIAPQSFTANEMEVIEHITHYMIKNSNGGVEYIYNIYKNTPYINNAIKNKFKYKIIYNINEPILEDIKKELNNENIANLKAKKLLDILKGLTKNEEIKDFLRNLLNKPWLPYDRIIEILGDEKASIEALNKKDASERSKCNAIIQLADSKKPKNMELIKKHRNESEVINLVVSSALVQMGEINEIKNLFIALVTSDDETIVNTARNQLRRLLIIKDTNVRIQFLKVVSAFILNNDGKNYEKSILRVISVYVGIKTDQYIGTVLLKKMETTNLISVKKEIIKYFVKTYYSYQENLKNAIMKQLIEDSKNKVISKEVLSAINKIKGSNAALPE